MKFVAIERLRAVAVVMVYLIHVSLSGNAFGYFRVLAPLGTWAGVDLFFVISGFVVTLSLERLLEGCPQPGSSGPEPSRPFGRSLRSFYVRRLFRLGPVALLTLAIHLVGAALGSRLTPETPFKSVPEVSVEALAVCSGFYNFVAPYLSHPPLTFFWSLSVEEQFYALLPMAFIVARTRRARTRVAAFVLLAIAVVIRPIFSPNVFVIAHYSSQYRFDALAAGVILALERDRIVPLVVRIPAVARKVLVVLALASILFVSRHVDIWFTVHYGLVFLWAASAWLVACAVAGEADVLGWPLLGPTLEYLGSRSYAIYLLHTAVLMAAQTLFLGAKPSIQSALSTPLAETVRFALTSAAVVLLAEVVHRVIELPSIRAGKVVAGQARRAELALRPWSVDGRDA